MFIFHKPTPLPPGLNFINLEAAHTILIRAQQFNVTLDQEKLLKDYGLTPSNYNDFLQSEATINRKLYVFLDHANLIRIQQNGFPPNLLSKHLNQPLSQIAAQAIRNNITQASMAKERVVPLVLNPNNTKTKLSARERLKKTKAEPTPTDRDKFLMAKTPTIVLPPPVIAATRPYFTYLQSLGLTITLADLPPPTLIDQIIHRETEIALNNILKQNFPKL